MKRIILSGLFGLFFSAILVLSAPNTSNSAIVALTNPSFENNLSGWIPSGTGIATSTTAFGIYTPQSGTRFLQLDVAAGNSLSVYQDFTATAGDTLSGWAGMVSASGNLKDVAYILTIYNNLGEYVWSGNTSTNGWQAWDWEASADGQYRLQYTLQNKGTSASTAVFDAPVSIPIPTTALLLATGLVGFVAIRRRMKR